MTVWDYQNRRIFLQRFTLQIGPWVYVIEVFHGGEIVGTFYKKELLKTKWKAFRAEKSNKGKRWQTVC